MKGLLLWLFPKPDPAADLVILDHAAEILLSRGYDAIARAVETAARVERDGLQQEARRAGAA